MDLPSVDRQRQTMRRSGFATKTQASDALTKVLECERAGVHLDDTQTVASYLHGWLATKSQALKPNTVARYRDYLHNDLIPAFGAVRLERLTRRHVQQFVDRELAAGRGLVTLRRCISTLSSALNDAVRHRRLTDNAARFTDIPQPSRTEMTCWSTAQAVAFLRFCRAVDSPLSELYELMICTGMRKGEVLGLHWSDVALDEQMLFVRNTLVSVNNARLMFNDPKTRGSRAWIALSPRAIDVLHRQRDRPRRERTAATRFDDLDLVFCRSDGQPLRPEYVLRHFRQLVADARLPSMRVHDLRHLAATIMIAEGVPLAVVSKTMRHKTLSTTVDIYGHLTRQAAQDGVDATAAALTQPPAARPYLRLASTVLGCDHQATTSPRNDASGHASTCISAGQTRRADRI